MGMNITIRLLSFIFLLVLLVSLFTEDLIPTWAIIFASIGAFSSYFLIRRNDKKRSETG